MSEATEPSSRNAQGIYEPFDVTQVPLVQHRHGTRFGMDYRHLSSYGGGSRISVSLETLPPGLQANPAHYHLLEEEHVLILEGSLTLRLGDARYVMTADQYVCFPAGQTAGHALINHTDQPCRYLVWGSPHPHDVAIHTDTGYVQVKLTGRGYADSVTPGYWDGEEVDSPAP
ncbi:cupin domain-containing protein [Amantichitinum ursilacus]|uniref:Cupin domain protein n=1 Tax=Amantichitinum ursilacus TaxID=857265 RepID=A0A0N0XG90_9NEIS|nr:cupin domain-containing protein [Amantichitinum ursilacus]KPC49563.1 Cupin domain protein [Amantichitinum ursilacus]